MLTANIGGVEYDVDLSGAHDLAIENRLDGGGPRLFGGSGATETPYRSGGFIGSVAAGGSCNVTTMMITPHLDGTHTETVGHILDERHPVNRAIREVLVAASVVSVKPVEAPTAEDEWAEYAEPTDRLITKGLVEAALALCTDEFLDAVVVRTLPNEPSRQSQDYDDGGAAYFTAAAMTALVRRGVRHLVVDLPSIDRLNDDGRLICHRIFFGIEPNRRDDTEMCTITELAYIGSGVVDGSYLLNLQIPSFASEAAPSRPMLLRVRPRDDVNRT
jgi:kynurenine formamidase